MKTRAMVTLMFVAMLLCSTPSFAQQRLDITLEGPWAVYQEHNFPVTGGTTASVLVAIAPPVPGHNLPVFTTGDGATIGNFGIYCVAFDGTCKPNALTSLAWDGYPPPQLVGITTASGWNWADYAASAYVLIFPMPDSFSSDGMYSTSFQSSFPTPATAPVTTDSGPRSLGIVLHYAMGPQTLGLLSCSGTPSVSACNDSKINLPNTGNLQVVIRSIENPATPDNCDYHVHRAYSKMLHLLDPTLTYNAAKAYTDVPSYDKACSPCDPQQASLPTDCSARSMADPMAYPALLPDVPAALDSLVIFLKQLNVPGEQRSKVLGDLETQSTELNGKYASQSQLAKLKANLEKSRAEINKLLDHLADDAARNGDLKRDLEIAATRERAISIAGDAVIFNATSGKDCRVRTIQIN